MEWFIVILGLALESAFFVGYRFCIWYNDLRKDVMGTLRIDRSDPDGPYLFLELDKPLPSFENDKYVVFRVENENLISPK